MPPINQDLIRQALMQRLNEGQMQAPPMPAVDQISQPGGATPLGGPNVPMPGPSPMPMPPDGGGNMAPPMGPMGGAGAPNQAIKAAQAATSPQFDDQTRAISKALIAKLLSVM